MFNGRFTQAFLYHSFLECENKGVDQAVWIRDKAQIILVSTNYPYKWKKTSFLHVHNISDGLIAGEPINKMVFFVWFDSLRPINNLSVTCIKGRVFLGRTSTKLGLMFLLKDTTQWRR